jgi:hypothetical protein
MVERGGKARTIGQAALWVHQRVFELWHLFRGGGCRRAEMDDRMVPLMFALAEILRNGARGRDAKTKRFCVRLAAVFPALWTFVVVPGVQPTNNHAERVLRRITGQRDDLKGLVCSRSQPEDFKCSPPRRQLTESDRWRQGFHKMQDLALNRKQDLRQFCAISCNWSEAKLETERTEGQARQWRQFVFEVRSFRIWPAQRHRKVVAMGFLLKARKRRMAQNPDGLCREAFAKNQLIVERDMRWGQSRGSLHLTVDLPSLLHRKGIFDSRRELRGELVFKLAAFCSMAKVERDLDCALTLRWNLQLIGFYFKAAARRIET